jgi:hypothetical protein
MASFYRNPMPPGASPLPIPSAGVNLTPQTVAPPSGFAGAFGGATGPMTNGPALQSVPGLGTAQTGPMSTLYNGGTPGNRQMGMLTNESVKAAYVIVNDHKVDPDATMTRALGEGMLLFSASKTLDPLRTSSYHKNPADSAQTHYNSKLCVTYDLNGVNHMLHSSAYGGLYGQMSADQVLAAWRPLGVLKVEAAPSRTRVGDIKSNSRLVNLVVSHRVRTFNIWGGDIEVGTRLFVICKKVKVSDLARAYSGQKRSRDPEDGSTAPDVMKWVMYPYASKKRRVPPLSELYYMENGVRCLGACISIGFSMEDKHVIVNAPGSRGADGSTDWKAALNYMGKMDPTRNAHRRLLDTVEIQLCQ